LPLSTWITVAAPAGTDTLNRTAKLVPNATIPRRAHRPDLDPPRNREIVIYLVPSRFAM
jgi:hypothetical protein